MVLGDSIVDDILPLGWQVILNVIYQHGTYQEDQEGMLWYCNTPQLLTSVLVK